MYKRFVGIRSAMLVYLTHSIALPILKIIRKPVPFPYSKKDLQEMPPHSLGRDLFNMLEKNNLPLLSHYIKHDIKHIILGYETTDEGEVCLQSFMLGNGHLSFPVVITVVFGYLTMPEHWSEFLRAYNRGKISTKIKNWPWFQLILLPTQSLINKLNNHENT